jgi:putative ABC transport system permease protein
MNNTIQTIPVVNLVFAIIPVLVVIGILFKWSLNASNALYAMVRMLIQLLLIGYLLTYIFKSDSAWLVILILAVMVFSSSWIALGTVKDQRRVLYEKAFISITLGGGVTLILITQGVLNLYPWYWPQYMIPLAGMIFAGSMNSVSLAAERLNAEVDRGVSYEQARNIALRASLIPIINTLFAVGLVSLPGMMTGQILSGVSPLIAARYQIMVMFMLFGAAGLSSACFLKLVRPVFTTKQTNAHNNSINADG